MNRRSSSGIVILSGGQEVVSLAIAEALQAAGLDYVVVSLRVHSILRNAPGCERVIDISAFSGDPVALRPRLADELSEISTRAGKRLVTFATEDGGLRCLNEFSDVLLPLTEFPRARALRMGGLDKAELFEVMARSPAARHIPPTMVLDDVAQVPEALRKLGPDAIFKPALKPWDMDLGRMGAKVVSRGNEQESDRELLRRISHAWPLSSRWVAQSRLVGFADGERGAWLVGNGRHYAGISFVERWKHPRQGGTGCLVEVCKPQPEILEPAAEVLRSIDYVGLAEVPFLLDGAGSPKLLEINARAWLQVGLAEASGFRTILESLRAIDEGQSPQAFNETPTVWIHLERSVSAIVVGGVGPRSRAAAELLKELWRGAVIAVYSTPFPHVRWRWVMRVLRAALLRLLPKNA